MIWDDAVLEEVNNNLNAGSTYRLEAARLSIRDNWPDRISGEQLRSAVRRYRRRAEARYVPVNTAVAPKPLRAPEPVDYRVVREVTFGALGDTHLCSNYARQDILDSLYDMYADRSITRVYHTGNYVDGEASFNASSIHVRGVDNQCQYFIDHYPFREGIDTYYIDGDDHEGWWAQKPGIIAGQHIQDMASRAGRSDLKYLGYMEADVLLFPELQNQSPSMRILHPGGGSTYALSYTSQKIIDSYEDYEKPDVLLLGHYHKASLLPNYRGVLVIQTGCVQEPTPFMRKKRLHADLGGWIVTIGVNQNNRIAKLSAEFISFPMNAWRHR
jgi:hypothetical protein